MTTAPAGARPTSVAVHGPLVYVLDNGSATVLGFRQKADGSLSPLGEAELSSPDADGAQVAFSPDGSRLVVTERGTNAITTFAVGADGSLGGRTTQPSSGATPYGFEFTRRGAAVVTEAFGGRKGAAAASSYVLDGAPGLVPISGSVGNTRSEVCWAAIGADDRFAYVTNFGDGTISRYAIGGDGSLSLVEPVAASTVLGEPGIRDEAITSDGRFLYAIDADHGALFGWAVGADGGLEPLGSVGGLPATVAGLAAS